MILTQYNHHICRDAASLYELLAQQWVGVINATVAARGFCTIALAGGNTPRAFYRYLVESPWLEEIPWDQVRFFFSDERAVPPDHPDSNYRMVRENLLFHPQSQGAEIYPMRAELEHLRQESLRYAQTLRERTASNIHQIPSLDIILLGMGADGHTASLFPGTTALRETEQWVVPVYVERLNAWRMTLTYPLLNSAGRLFFLVTGADKAPTVRLINQLKSPDLNYPVSALMPQGKAEWYFDQAAAAGLN